MLAGNVTLSFTGGTLKLTGDNSANEITYRRASAACRFRL